MRGDLHLHSNNSDGIENIDQIEHLIKKITNDKVFISIVDHHYISLKSLKEVNNIVFIPGVEISCMLDDLPCHLIGYGANIKVTPSLVNIFNKTNEGYNIRAKKIYKNLKKLGYDLPPIDSIGKQSTNHVIYINDLAQALGESIGIKSVREVKKWAKQQSNLLFIKDGDYLPSAKTTIKCLKESGFVAIWAHPGRNLSIKTLDWKKKFDSCLVKYLNFGLDGIEVFYPYHTHEQTQYFLEKAEQNALLITGGSDYHGKERGPNVPLLNLKNNYINSFVNDLNFF